MSRILITGGSGFIGSHFRESLQGADLINYDILPPLTDDASQYVEGDIHDVEKLSATLQEDDTVLHLAATHFDFQKNYHKTNVDGTAALIKAMENANVRKIVFLSSVAVYGKISKPTSEDDQPNPNMPYGESKLEAEKLLLEWQKKDPERLLIISRPTVVYGPRNFGNVFNLIKQIDSGFYFHIGSGENVKSITYVKNLVQSCIEVMGKYDKGVYLFNNIDDKQVNTRDLGDLIAGLLNKKIKIRIPKFLALTLAIPFDILKKVFGKETPISRERVQKFMASTHFLPAFLQKEGIKSRYPAEQGLQETIDWYKSVDWKNLYAQWQQRVKSYE